MKSTCWDTGATDSIIESGKKDTEASILIMQGIRTYLFNDFLFLIAYYFHS